jgi:hypothetical protein
MKDRTDWSLFSPDFKYLSEKRMNEATSAIEQMKAQKLKIDKSTIPYLLLEEYKTQQSLNELNVTTLTSPSDIPFINELLPQETKIDKTKPLLIEVIGTPLTGKTSLIAGGIRYAQPPYYPIIEVVKYAKGIVPKLDLLSLLITKLGLKSGIDIHKEMFGIDKSVDFELTKLLLNFNVFDVLDKMAGNKMAQSPVVLDRWYLDQKIFARARFLSGKLSVAGYKPICAPNKQIDSFVQGFSQFYNHVVINCLNIPAESMSHAKRQGDTINQNSLEIIYQQYLRAHQEIITLENRSFAYKALDLSGKSIEQNQQIFDLTISDIYKNYLA